MRSKEKWRQWHLRRLYADGWEVLSAWATCACDPGACPLQEAMDRLGVEPGDLLLAMVTGNPSLIGVTR